VNMNEVDPLFDNWRHTQAFEITLLRPGNNNTGDNWLMGFTPAQSPAYGLDVKAVSTFINVGNSTLDISCGAETLEDWLAMVYYPTLPLYDARTETGPLVPNFVVVVSGIHRVEIPIANWNSEITVEAAPGEGKLVFLEFLRKTATDDLQLAVAGLVTHQQQA